MIVEALPNTSVSSAPGISRSALGKARCGGNVSTIDWEEQGDYKSCDSLTIVSALRVLMGVVLIMITV